MNAPEPRNPFYHLLLLASLAFVVTALAYAVVPALEQQAIAAGNPPPPSPFREALRRDGGTWLFGEVAAIFVFALASMGLDRMRSLQKERTEATISTNVEQPPSSSPNE